MINNRFHVRLFEDGKVYDEMACELKEDIGFITATMLRWYDKTIGTSKMAAAARDRLNRKQSIQKGKIWYKPQLDRENGN